MRDDSHNRRLEQMLVVMESAGRDLDRSTARFKAANDSLETYQLKAWGLKPGSPSQWSQNQLKDERRPAQPDFPRSR